MDKKEIKQRIEKLRELINYHRYLYHVLDRQEISEAALDSLKKELFELEQKFPEFITLDSPTQRVGSQPLKKFGKVRHPSPMLSLNDAFSEKDIKDWLERISKLLVPEEVKKLDFYCELKIDGLAIELIYENGILKIGSTRGDGIIGENVTQNLKTIEAIPLRLKEVRPPLSSGGRTSKQFVVRGEVFIKKKDFEKVNKEQEKFNLPIYANPRNLAAGSIRQLDPKITASRRLDFFAYELIGRGPTLIATHEGNHKVLKELGFKTNPYNKYCKNLSEVFEFHKEIQRIREKIPYEIDGVVVIVNSNKIFEKLGKIGKAPRGAVAFKFPGKQATTVVEEIKVQVGRTGALTPVAILKPVQVAGVTISRATLHNEDEISRLGVKIGDTVIVGRAGDVIPDIIKVLPRLRTGKERDFKMPINCPICGNKVIKPESEVLSRCSNSDCFAQKKEYFKHFISKGAFNIVGLGPKIIDRLLSEGLIFDPADLFELKEGDILPLERFAEKSARNLIKAIQSGKEISLARFIYALGIRNIGEQTAIDLAEYFGVLENIQKTTPEELQKIQDIGPVAARSISGWFYHKRNQKFLEKLKEVGVIIKNVGVIHKLSLRGKIFVLTGALATITREGAKEKIRQLGGQVSESVSKSTDFIVVGSEPGLKYEKAKKLGIKIISEKEFLKMINKIY
ncbi:MAG: NAD-dependent DNA ligase LigA [Candidatus Nealsonbacteria bacterium]|nr:NAD-dependent DNA ligase LigA [Candidatus Nealsonbacteria bacterium]